ncbi:hypothetical protein AM588_10011391 [Phytophthora nicotianae]|uniref:histidinol-phosphate transaminase n=1 Tax=Phytophthora nicotianae TaxID=4792 RepID=A0A0W8DJM7_PHYNI|nr:hypothetical protein AM588_10011391 [Phytophthora nicotianae]
MDKQSAIALGVTAGLGVGYLLGKAQPSVPRVKAGQKPTTDLDEVERLIRPNILSLTPYRCARDDYDQGNMAGHSQLQAMELERYPCPYQPELKNVITDFRNQNSTEKISQANAFLGVGSDEAIDLIIRVACTPRVDNIMITPPTYGMYSVCANIHDVGIVSVPLQIEALAENLKGLKPDLPLPAFHIDPQEKYKGFVVVDEAYIDFSDTASLCTLVNKHRRLIVLQTLSKGFGLAGIRLGVAFGDPKLIQVLNNVKAPYNISKLTSDVARKAFSNLDELRKNVNLIKEASEKYRVIKELQKLSFVRCIYASDSNFVLFEIPHALSVYRQMAGRGVVIRYRGNQHLLTDCLRATIGSREENDRMLELLVEVYGEQ